MKIVDDDIITKFLNIKSLGDKLEWYNGNSEYSHGGFAKKGLCYVLPKIENVDFKVLNHDESNLSKAAENIDSVNIKWENNKLVWRFNNQNILELEICDETLKSQLIKDEKVVVTDENKQEKEAVTDALMKLEQPAKKEVKKEPIIAEDIKKIEKENNRLAKVDETKKLVANKLERIEESIENKTKKLEEEAKSKLFGTGSVVSNKQEKPEDSTENKTKKLVDDAKAKLFGTKKKVEKDIDTLKLSGPTKKLEGDAKVEETKQKGGNRRYKSKHKVKKCKHRRSKRKRRLLI